MLIWPNRDWAEEGRIHMAKRKRSTRSPSRSPKRSSSRSAARGSSTGIFLALAVIVGVGALSVWSATQHKGPLKAFAGWFERPAAQTSRSAAAKPDADVKQTVKAAPRQENIPATAFNAPIPRPSIPVGAQPNPVLPTPLQRAALQQPQPLQRPALAVGPAERTGIHLPRGINMPNMTPSVVYARERLTLRRNAWDKSEPAGTVEKGREMRSYGKTGKWHHIVIPATDMIGWVHEDMLIAGKTHPGTSGMTTGAISGTPRSTQVQAIYPPRPVGAQ